MLNMPGNNTTAWEISDSSYGRELTLFVDWTDDLMPIFEAEGIQSLVLVGAGRKLHNLRVVCRSKNTEP